MYRDNYIEYSRIKLAYIKTIIMEKNSCYETAVLQNNVMSMWYHCPGVAMALINHLY